MTFQDMGIQFTSDSDPKIQINKMNTVLAEGPSINSGEQVVEEALAIVMSDRYADLANAYQDCTHEFMKVEKRTAIEGEHYAASILADCQKACVQIGTCLSIDFWDAQDKPVSPARCFLHKKEKTIEKSGGDHYDLIRSPPSCGCTDSFVKNHLMMMRSVVAPVDVGVAKSLHECKLQCINDIGCHSFDYVPAAKEKQCVILQKRDPPDATNELRLTSDHYDLIRAPQDLTRPPCGTEPSRAVKKTKSRSSGMKMTSDHHVIIIACIVAVSFALD